jgi:hypothetical protein
VPEATKSQQVIYGRLFVLSRFLHNSGLIFRTTYARLIGSLVSILVLAAIKLDLNKLKKEVITTLLNHSQTILYLTKYKIFLIHRKNK